MLNSEILFGKTELMLEDASPLRSTFVSFVERLPRFKANIDWANTPFSGVSGFFHLGPN